MNSIPLRPSFFKTALLALIALSSLTQVTSAQTNQPLPDFTKAFPKQMFLEETAVRSVSVYAYLTNEGFKTLKGQFVKYIGGSWVEQEMTEEIKAQIAAGAPGMTVSGSAIFRSEQFPDTQLTLTQIEIQGQMMTSITVLDLSAIPPTELQ